MCHSVSWTSAPAVVPASEVRLGPTVSRGPALRDGDIISVRLAYGYTQCRIFLIPAAITAAVPGVREGPLAPVLGGVGSPCPRPGRRRPASRAAVQIALHRAAFACCAWREPRRR